MMFSKKMYTKTSIILALIVSTQALSFAGNTLSDVPSSANENRTIKHETTLYTDTCDISQELAFYNGSPVFLRIAQPKGPVNYSFDKAETYVRVYGGNVFGSAIKFPYISNIVPSSTVDTANTTILTVEAKDGIFSGQASTPRNQIAGQIISKNMERSLIVNNNGSTINYYYRRSSDYSVHNGNIKALINPNITKKTACTNYYVARCGDGVIDKATGSSDGNGGIQTQGGTFLSWHTNSIKPNEVCDDGAQNGQPGKCKTDCTGIGGGTPPTGGATCTLTASSATITSGQTVTLTASFTSGATASFSPELSVTPAFTYPTWNGTATATPTTTTTYVLNVGGANGLSGTSCSTTVSVPQPIPHLSCLLTINPGYVTTGTIVSVGWKIANGNFFGTDINVSPSMYGWPTTIPANLYNGVRQAVPLTTGDFNFSLFVYNNLEEYTCTGILHVIENIPAGCSLTTSTPMIMPGQTGYLNASYGNAVLATLTPAITGLNFLYPVRNNNAIAVHPTDTTTYTLNTLNPFGTGSTCTATIGVMNTGVVLNKQLVTNIPYRSGDQVSFKISFANQGPSVVNNVIVSDYLPAGLDYVTSQIFGVAPFTFATGTNGSNQFVEYSGFSLTPGQQGYIIVVGRYKGYEYANQTLNNAFLKASNSPDKYSSALFYSYRPSGNATVTKTSDKPSYVPGEDARFTIAVTNNGPDAISNVRITDDRPNTDCITPDSQWTTNMPNPPFSMTTPTDPYVWTYNSSLAVGQTIYLYITGHISNSASCVGSYINNANIAYDVNAVTQTGVAPGANFQISTTPSSTVVFEKKLVQYGNNSGDPVVFELLYHNNGTATISNFDIVDYWPGTLNFVSSSPLPTTQIPTQGGRELHWIVNSPLAPNAVGKITINGTIR